MAEDWYTNATPEYKWLADVFGAKTKEELDKKVPVSLQNSLTDMYNTDERRFGTPGYDDYTFARAYNDEQAFDQDLYNSIKKLGYEGMRFIDLNRDHWNNILKDYMVGYNDFQAKHPYIPYGLRMEDGYRRQWDPTYEGYKGVQQQNETQTPTIKTTPTPTTPSLEVQRTMSKSKNSEPDTHSNVAIPESTAPLVPQITIPEAPVIRKVENANLFKDIKEKQEAQNGKFKLKRDKQGNYYTNDVRTPTNVLNLESVPNKKGNQQPQTQIASMDDLARAMGYTSPQEEEKIRRASLTNQKIMAVTDALRHIGNIANTVHYAPAQQFNNPVLEEEARYQKGKALRDKANYTYLNYQQQKAIQDAKAKQWEEEREYKNRMLDHYRDQDRRLWRQQDETARRNAVLEDLKRQELEVRKAYNEGRLSIADFNKQTARIRALRMGLSSGRGGKGMDEYTVTTNTTYNYDENGKKTGSTTTKERTVNGKKQPKQTVKKQNPMGGSGNGKKKNPMS